MSEPVVSIINTADALAPAAPFCSADLTRNWNNRPTDSPALQSVEQDMVSSQTEIYSAGFDEGTRMERKALATEREALKRLVEKAEVLQPEPSEELATLIAETVFGLVEQIVGEVDIDRDHYRNRAMAAARIISECDKARTLYVHPADAAFLNGCDITLAINEDPSLDRGSLRIDCSTGWIEHGTPLYLDALRTELGLPRGAV